MTPWEPNQLFAYIEKEPKKWKKFIEAPDNPFVTAYARKPQKLSELTNDNLIIFQGELDDKNIIAKVINDTDVVISFLGPTGKVNDTSLSNGMKNIIEAMRGANKNRIISISTGSVKDSCDRYDFSYNLFIKIIKLFFRKSYDEIIKISNIIRNSNFDWTLVRIGLLNNNAISPIKTGYYGYGKIKTQVSRASVAKFLLDQVTSKEFVKKSPAISNWNICCQGTVVPGQ